MVASSGSGETASTPPRILVVDDDFDVGEFIAAAAQAMGFYCTVTLNAAAFLAAFRPDVTLILSDLMMPDMDGIELLRILAERHCKAGIVLMSGIDRRVLESAEELAKSLGLSVIGRLHKPFRLVELEDTLRTHGRSSAAPVLARPPAIDISETDLRHGIDGDEFVLHYQPQLDIASGRVVGVEALVRWQHPTLGLVFPDAFIGRAESLGLIDELGWLIVKRGLTEYGDLARIGGARLKLSLNVSPYSLHDLRFPDRLVALAGECGVPPANIVLEITESGLIKELSSALDILTRLRMKLVKLSIDDFGTGYAMLQQLRNVPATELKIDKSFVHHMDTQDQARVMVHKTIELAHELGMSVVAEGVETAAQLEYLRANGCDFAQGYLFSRPLPPSEMRRWLEGRTGANSYGDA